MRRQLLMLLLLGLISTEALSQQGSALLPRVQQLVNSGNRTAARALADSALSVAAAGSLAYAEALFARAFASADAAAAERDYSRVALEFPQSARVEESLLAAGQFRMARGDRAGARRMFERLTQEFPNSTNAVRVAFWAGRMALEDGELTKGCASLAFASERSGSDVELRNQIEYLHARCRLPRANAVSDSLRADSARAATPGVAAAEYSVQVAAYSRRSDADALARRLRQRGFAVRVVGTVTPYRVRVGRYATRDLAEAARGRMKRANVNGIVVEAEPK